MERVVCFKAEEVEGCGEDFGPYTEDRVGGYGIVSDNDMGRENSVSKW